MTTKPKKLTPKQVQFVLAYRETGNGTEAYRRIYNTTNMAPKTINREATRLLDHPLIKTWLAELEAEDRIRCAVTVELLTEKMWEDRDFARRSDNAQTALNATVAVAKLHGLVDGDASKGGVSAVNIMLNLPPIDEEELLRRYAETLAIKREMEQPHKVKVIEHGGNGSGDGGDLRS